MLSLLVPSADNLCKLFGPPKHRPHLDPNCLTLFEIAGIPARIFKSVDFEKYQLKKA